MTCSRVLTVEFLLRPRSLVPVGEVDEGEVPEFLDALHAAVRGAAEGISNLVFGRREQQVPHVQNRHLPEDRRRRVSQERDVGLGGRSGR